MSFTRIQWGFARRAMFATTARTAIWHTALCLFKSDF